MIQSIEAEPRRKMSKTGSSVEQVNDFYLIAFHVMAHKNVLVTHCCNKNKHSERESLKRWPKERERLKDSRCDASSLP